MIKKGDYVYHTDFPEMERRVLDIDGKKVLLSGFYEYVSMEKVKKIKPMILLIGRTGTGKSYSAAILEEKRNLRILKSYTTRKKRNECDTDHIFISEEEADNIKERVAYTEIDGYRYFASRAQLNTSDIYIIDPRGYDMLLERAKGFIFYVIYINGGSERQNACMNRRKDDSDAFVKRDTSEAEEFDEFEERIRNGKVSNVFEVENTYDDRYENRLLEIFDKINFS